MTPPRDRASSESFGRQRVTAAIRLHTLNLSAIGDRGVVVPRYDRGKLVPRILHVGVGGFHRAHMALYTDDAVGNGGDWGIRGVGQTSWGPTVFAICPDNSVARNLAEQLSTDPRWRGGRVQLARPLNSGAAVEIEE